MGFKEFKEAIDILSKYVDNEDIKAFGGRLIIKCEDVENSDEQRLDELGWYQDHNYWITDLA